MNIKILIILLTIGLVLGTYSISNSALAQNEHATVPDLPENASFHAIPFKEIIIDANGYRAVFKPLITTTNDPSEYVSGTLFEGVPVLLLPRDDIDPQFVAVCSGTLLPTGMHILTAAHCVTDDSGELILTPNAGAQARFGGDIDDISKRFFIDVSKTQVHDEYTGDMFRGNDIAVLTLYSEAIGIPTYDIYRGDAEIGENIQKVGFGRSGTLAHGDDLGLGIKRDGLNKIDDDADAFLEFFNMVAGTHFDSGAILMYDGDNGLEKNDAFGVLLGDPNSPNKYNDLGIVNDEVLTAGGDSGGPAFYNNKIVGVTSFGVVVGGSFGSSTSDCHKSIVRGSNFPNSSCGEFAGDTRVSPHQTFIDDIINLGPDITRPTPEIASSETSPTNADPVPFTVDFGEAINPDTFTLSDISAPGGTVQNLAHPDNNQNWTFEVASTDDLSTLSVSIAAELLEDTSDNLNFASNTVNIEIDRIAPDAPSIASPSPTTTDNTPTITGTGVSGETITLSSNLDGNVGTVTVSGTDTWSITTSPLQVGSHLLRATQTDSAGNTSLQSEPVSLVVEALPGVSVDSIVPNEGSKNTSVDVTIYGSGFVSGAQVTLVNGNGPTPSVSGELVSDDGTTITATITIKNGGPRGDISWDVTVTNTDSSSDTLADGFTVTPN